MRRKNKILSMFLCILMIFSAFSISNPEETAARTLAEIDKDLSECQALLAKLQGSKSSVSEKINDLNNQSAYTAQQLSGYIVEIEYLTAEIAVTEETIAAYNVKIQDINTDILLQEENLAYYKEIYASIIRYSFIEGDTSYFEILFESENFSDFLTRIDNLNYFLDYTDSVMDSITVATNDLAISKANHESAQATLTEYNNNLQAKQSELETKKSQLEAKASQIGTSLSQLQSQYSSADNNITEVKAKIAALKKEREQATIIPNSEYRWPLPQKFYVSSGFGGRTSPITGRPEFHNGIDIPAPYGTNILASNSGTVIRSELAGSWGNVIVIDHGNGVTTLYAHCSSLLVHKGDTVKQSDVIGKVGSTGNSTGNHLHFSVITNGSYVNPNKYLPKGYC